ncbi:MAG: MBL fold metallo-hydrolase [Bacteriovoracia bacterium]
MSVKLSFIEAGHCVHPKFVVLPGSGVAPVRFPASVAVIDHPKHGITLFDTGYSMKFYEQTRHFPEKLYALVTPVTVTPETTAVSLLKARGIAAGDVRKVILSHFHADHVAGAGDFLAAEYVYFSHAYAGLRRKGRLGALKAGVLLGLLPGDFEARSRPIDPSQLTPAGAYSGFSSVHDVFGDGTVHAVELPGHARGQMGLIVQAETGPHFLVADACWLTESIERNRPPNQVTRLLFDDYGRYTETLDRIAKLHQAHPDLKIIPCHCERALRAC